MVLTGDFSQTFFIVGKLVPQNNYFHVLVTAVEQLKEETCILLLGRP